MDKLNKIVEQQRFNRRKILAYLYESWALDPKKYPSFDEIKEHTGLEEINCQNAVNYLRSKGLVDFTIPNKTRVYAIKAFFSGAVEEYHWIITRNGREKVESWIIETSKKEIVWKGKYSILPQFEDSKPQSFTQITITITHDLRHTLIKCGANKKNYHYRDLGLENPRGKKESTRQKKVWGDLIILAANSDLTKRGPEYAQKKISKERISKLRSFLKSITGITDEDPIPYDFKSRLYSPVFEIGISDKLKATENLSMNDDDEYLEDRFHDFRDEYGNKPL